MKKTYGIFQCLALLLVASVIFSACPIVIAQANETYLNDLTPTSWYGEKAPMINTNLKGETIAFADGKTFDKGVSFSNNWVGSMNGFFAGAVYDISSYTYNRFSATVGSLTDYTSDTTRMYYAVKVDGKVLAVTPMVNHSAGSFEIDVEIPAGAQSIEVMGRAIPNNACGTFCFANPKLYNGEPDPADETIYVSDLTPTASFADSNGIKANSDLMGNPISYLDGYTAKNGIAFSVNYHETLGWVASATYDISNLDVNYFSAQVGKGMDYYDGSTTELTYVVLADGAEIVRSRVVSAITADSVALEAAFPEGTQTLELRMLASPNNICGTGSFANAILSKNTAVVEEVYLDTLTPASWYGEKAPVANQNMAGGQIAFADGKAFNKGVSLSNAWVGGLNGFFAGAVYDISGYDYNRFSATVGSLTDYVSEDISMYYSVMVDGKPLAVSQWMKHSQGSVVFDVEIPKGAQTLELRSRAIPHNGCATLSFANAKLYNGDPDPVDSTIYVSDLTPTASSSDGGIRNNVDCLGSPIAYLDGYTATKGIGMAVVHNDTLGWHASATYDVSGLDVNHISARVGKGMDYYDGSTTELVYTILADGVAVAISEPVSAVNKKSVELNAFFPEGTQTLEFRMQSGNTNSCGTGSFANAILSKQDAPADELYLNTLTPTSWYGEKEPIVNQNLAGGQIAFADGKTFNRGVSFSNAWVGDLNWFYAGAVYDISGYTYNRFSTTVGSLTDYTSDATYMYYSVLADGKVLAVTPMVNHSAGSFDIDVEIPKGAQNIELRTMAYPNNSCGTAAYANPKLYYGEADPADENIYVSDLPTTSYFGDGPYVTDTDRIGNPIAFMDGYTAEKGVAMSVGLDANLGWVSYATYDISALDVNCFTAHVGKGMDYFNGSTTEVSFGVLIDGVEYARSRAHSAVTADSSELLVYFPKGAKTLELRMYAAPNNICGTGAFANPILSKDEIPQEVLDQWAAEPVKAQIAALNVQTLGDKAAVEAARAAYTALSDAQKALVDNLAALEAAEAAIVALEEAAADQAAADRAAAKAVEDAIAALTQKVFMFNDCDNNNDEGGTEIVANYNSGALDKEITAEGYAKFILKNAGAPDFPMTFRCPTGVVASDYDEIVFEIYLSEGMEIVTGSWGNTHYQTAYGGIDEHKVDSVGLASYFEQLVPGQWNTVRMPVTAKTDLIKQITLRPYGIFKGAAGDYVMVDNIRFEATKEISLDDKEAVEAARAAYDGLTDDQKALVGNVAALEAAEAAIVALEAASDKAAADAVKAQIAALNVQTLGDRAAVEAARAAYDDLTEAQKALVDNVAALETAEAAIVALEKAAEESAADKAAADEVVAIIEALVVESLEDKAAVEAARTAYDALTDAQKAFVTNLSKLEEAEGVIIAMEAEVADTAAAQAVEDKIAVFKTAANKKGIAAARAAYDALTDAQKAKVSNLARLQELENDAKLVAEVTAMIDAIQPGDQAAISAARAAYNALTFNQKMLITNEHRFVQLEMAL